MMTEIGRRQWIAAVGAALVACERTRAPVGAASVGAASVGAASVGAVTAARVGDFEPALGSPLRIATADHGVLVVLRGGFAIATGDTLRSRARDGGAERCAAATAGGWIVGARRYDRHGKGGEFLRGSGILDASEARQLALHVRGDDWITAVDTRGSDRPAALVVVRRGLGTSWNFEQPGRVAAAIADDGTLALVGDDGHLRVLADPTDGGDRPRIEVDVALDTPGYAVAIDAHGITMLAAPRIDARRDGGLRIAAPPDWLPDAPWPTTVVDLGRDGRERSRAELPFAGLQVLRSAAYGAAVFGLGAAQVGAGDVVWTRTRGHRVHGCAAGSGVILGDGASVERLDARGVLQQVVPILGGPIVCPPAVAPDGALWVATARSLWRLS